MSARSASVARRAGGGASKKRGARAGSAHPARPRVTPSARARAAQPATVPIGAVAALFIERQHLDRPRGQRLTADSLVRFATDTGGLQMDSINVVDRAHYLTAWCRFGPFDRAGYDRLA